MRNILFALFLFLPSVCFGQQFNLVIDSDQYPPSIKDSVIPLNDNQAILSWRLEPRGGSVVDASIIPSFTYVSGGGATSFGWVYAEGTVGVDGFTQYYSVIDKSTFFARGSSSSLSGFLTAIQSILSSKGLGTVSQRQALINSFTGSPVQIINPSDIYAGFLNLFGPYANIFIGVFLTLFVVDLMTRKTKATVAESAKVARAAERREISQQIKNDTTAQVYKYRLSNLAGIKSGRIQDSEISQSQARRMFRETAEEYAEYRRSRGWVY